MSEKPAAELRLDGIRKSFGPVEVLKGIDLALDGGEFLVLVGPSGCGKSTLLNLIAGLETLSEGRIYIGDRLVNDIHPKDRNIAMVFQSYALYPTKTVHGNITFGMMTRGVPRDQQAQAVSEVAQLLHIEPLLDRKPAELSGGQRQRVAMGRALVRQPDVFLFDEPLSNLDAKLRIEMRTEIKKLHQRLGKTIVYVTHDQVEAMTLASRIAVMDNGHIRQFADPHTVYNEPQDLFVASFMGSPPMNLLRGRLVHDGAPAVLVTAGQDSVQFPLPPPLAEAMDGRAGTEVWLGIRPENIAIAGRNRGRPPAHPFRLDRVIDVIEPTGPDTMLVFQVAGHEAIARVHAEDEVLPQTAIELEIDMAKARLFDVETGRRI
ncbi:MAG: sn-glycerol-3-phosphate ABC transporter ATP-binding protein UgpC [Hyphomicrobiales bacterium]|nr:sn-glycerol-3-phosphate ABC transporter ATP-binding protein UgpC [Hyphomicrobiales bacterium]